MCGLVGFLTPTPWASDETAPVLLARMADTIMHRGPDSEGYWNNEASGIAMGHRRLSIIELSDAGAQPMLSTSGRYMLVFNGEIYNHNQLRKKIGEVQWCGHSDTETLLAAIEAWGIEVALKHCSGMFAIALWDKQNQTLTLALDRIGEKPLYYGWQGKGKKSCFLFGSDLLALKEHPAFVGEVNRDSLALYMRHGVVPSPYSIYKGIYKLTPGSLLTVSLASPEPKLTSYWSFEQVAEYGVANQFSGTDSEAIETLEALLMNAVQQQMLADVPLGAFLSGGIDSSTVVALMQAQSNRPIKTFSIGFSEEDYNEAKHAKKVANYLGTEHTELYVTSQMSLDVIPQLPMMYSEPFADSSQIPTFLVSQLARQKVKVSLSGDAGDELFGGYNRYLFARNLWQRIGHLPLPLRRLAARVSGFSPSAWNAFLLPFQSFMPSLRQTNLGDKFEKGSRLLTSSSLDELYLRMISGSDPDGLVLGAKEPFTKLRGIRPTLNGLDDVQRMMALDSITYLPDDILVKIDRAAMSASLETRVPFLDHRVVEFAWQLPQHFKLRNGISKWVLREVLNRHVPRNFFNRHKMGFGVPISSWLRGPLQEWAEDLLSESALAQEGYLNPLPIRQKWFEHLSGQRNWHGYLWRVLMFQSWLRNHKQG